LNITNGGDIEWDGKLARLLDGRMWESLAFSEDYTVLPGDYE